MDGLRVLITNNTLAARAGSELYVRDLAIELLRRGHAPIAYSTVLGDVACELRLATVPVIDDLDLLSEPPDIIHGHHHLDTMTALLHFPGVPAVSFCHGWLPWEEMPPRFPRVLRYVAVDHTCLDRLISEHGINREHTRVLPNFVDLKRFHPRGPLPKRPQRAVVFNNEANEHSGLNEIRKACNRFNISVGAIGISSGNASKRPEDLLGNYDIVFGKGRSALEALAVGAAVIVLDGTRVGPMVTMENLSRLRSLNFGIRALCNPIDADVIANEVARYDAADAAEVSRSIRACAGLEKTADELLSLYEEVIDEYRLSPKEDFLAEERAAAAYLRVLAPRLKHHDRTQVNLLEMQDALRLRAAELETELETVTNTFGWRLLSHYGPVKYRFVKPAYDRIARLLGSSAKREKHS